MSTQQGIREDVNRKRRTHKKSRLGCPNCKLRRVKCDETRPQCKNCKSFGVSCNYDLNVADLQLYISGTASITKSPAFLFPVNNDSTFQLDRQSLDRLGRFQVRTVHSIGPARIAQFYQNEVIRLAYLHPYLMHGVQTITAIHDRYLSASPARQTRTEVYHFCRVASLFNQKLSTPLQPSDSDALCATAALLGVIAFSCFEASTPEEAWPLKTPAHSDLQWLKMLEGKNTVWKVADPLRLDSSFFRTLDHDLSFPASTSSGVENIPSAFIQVYDLENTSTAENNPYHAAVHTLAPLLHIECVQSTIPRFLSFAWCMRPAFKMLLEQKDSRALVLLAYWYAKVCHSQWWIARRALLECQAICLYLERHHAGDTAIQELVQFPKMQMQCELCLDEYTK
ncbi:hypothetical protein V1520DRAFT_346561 [Lipomyces starkeyi]|uniref:Zn(2)-C6 fungal-type domain-containing protein n=1 Tax=Lipomyces starkeyi NRRL Y-11557 TaxID=675824 RepID=A0A1E3PVK3_LIPST|nr:hypothetical protein LIPSTDRAFT_100122 [Lipomyces starkeyi NRRL Y-11557]